MSSTTERTETARGFYASSSIALGIASAMLEDPLCSLRRGLGDRFPKLATQVLDELGPHLVADVEAGRATLDEAVHIGLQRLEGVLRRRIADEVAAASVTS